LSRSLRVSPQAQRSLDDIARWTAGQFGARQARVYGAMLATAIAGIRRGTAAHRSVRDVLAPRAPADLRFVKAGAHFVLFREKEGQVEVTDVLHEAMDVAARVRG
jgi:toxin ParE1/3/4